MPSIIMKHNSSRLYYICRRLVRLQPRAAKLRRAGSRMQLAFQAATWRLVEPWARLHASLVGLFAQKLPP